MVAVVWDWVHHSTFTVACASTGNSASVVSLVCRTFVALLKVEKFHQLWNFRNCQHAIMEQQPEGYYKLITELQSD